jgi:hypothetical protein
MTETSDSPTAEVPDVPVVEDPRASEETQVIPAQLSRRAVDDYDDRPHLIPGFDRDDSETTAMVNDGDTTAVISGGDRTMPLPRVGDDTAVEETQVIPTEPPNPPKRPGRSPRRRR